MPTLVLLAGPNGAGKTPFFNGFLRERAEAFRFVNPDEVARGGRPLVRHPPASRAFAAQTGGPGGARERDPKGGAQQPTCRAHRGPASFRNRSPSAPPGPPVCAALRRRMTTRMGCTRALFSLTSYPELILRALQDAAHTAKHGAREAQSGQFLPPGWKGRLITADDDGLSKPAQGGSA